MDSIIVEEPMSYSANSLVFVRTRIYLLPGKSALQRANPHSMVRIHVLVFKLHTFKRLFDVDASSSSSELRVRVRISDRWPGTSREYSLDGSFDSSDFFSAIGIVYASNALLLRDTTI